MMTQTRTKLLPFCVTVLGSVHSETRYWLFCGCWMLLASWDPCPPHSIFPRFKNKAGGLCQSLSCGCDKVPGQNQLKGERIDSGHSSRVSVHHGAAEGGARRGRSRQKTEAAGQFIFTIGKQRELSTCVHLNFSILH